MSLKNLALALVTAVIGTLSPIQLTANAHPRIAITQLVQHEAADLVREGILEALLQAGYEDGKTVHIIYENAQGSPTTAAQIASKFAGMDLDLIMPITTASAQTIVKAQKGNTTPIVFSAVTNPVQAGLVKDLKNHKGAVTGVTDLPPIKEQLAFIKQILPKAKTIGVLYNPGDEGSAVSVKLIKDAANKEGLTIIESPATRSIDVKGAVISLVGRVDAVYVPLDNTFVSAMRTVSQLALQNNLPLFTADSGSVIDGAFACLGYSYFDHGRLAGEIAVKILKGEQPQNIPISESEKKTVYINTQATQQLGIDIPQDIASKAEFL